MKGMRTKFKVGENIHLVVFNCILSGAEAIAQFKVMLHESGQPVCVDTKIEITHISECGEAWL